MKITTFISVVAYARNEEKTVGQFLVQMDQFLNPRFETYEIILVDDDSTDNTLQEAFAVKDVVQGNVTVVSLRGRHGVDLALTAGTDLSIGDLIYEVEQPQASNPILARLYEIIEGEGVDIVLGSKMRLVTRRALYALAKGQGNNRAQQYRHCGFDWVQHGDPPSGKGSILKPSFYQRLLYILAGLFLAAGLVLIPSGLGWTQPGTAVAGVMLVGFALILTALGIIHSKIDSSPQTLHDSYKVKEITRINRY